MSSLAARVAHAMELRTLVQPGDRVLVAVSGGLDSMVLLHLLHRFSTSSDLQLMLAVGHFDHRLRGRASLSDARFVARQSAALGLRCIQESADVAEFARNHQMSIEMAARTLRHRFLARAAGAFGARIVALAHHADDQVELFFLRLLRGAGTEGLGGMNWEAPSPENRDVRLIRPLLGERRETLQTYAHEHHLRFREDATNQTIVILRNRLRHHLLPLLRRQYQSALDAIILRTMESLRGDSAFITEATEAWCTARRKPAFASLAPALQRRILSRQLRNLNLEVGFNLVERLRLTAGEPVCVGPGLCLRREISGALSRVPQAGTHFRADESAIDLSGQGGLCHFGGLELRWRTGRPRAGRPPKASGRRRPFELFDADKIGPIAVLRHWRPGDRFHPTGLAQPAKLQNLFVNLRIPRELRHGLVVATTRAGEIFWVEGLRMADGFKLDKQTQRSLKWAWHRE